MIDFYILESVVAPVHNEVMYTYVLIDRRHIWLKILNLFVLQ